jgi:hypothetical protein
MKRNPSTSTLVATLLALVIPVSGTAQESGQVVDSVVGTKPELTRHHRYKLIDLGPFAGGARSYFSLGSGNQAPQYSHVLNDRGEAAGLANTAVPDPFQPFCFIAGDCFATHAFETSNGRGITDLGVLPGGANSAATWISNNGLIAGLSQNGELDPLLPGFPISHATLWQRREIIDLGTLPEGGYESYADRGARADGFQAAPYAQKDASQQPIRRPRKALSVASRPSCAGVTDGTCVSSAMRSFGSSELDSCHVERLADLRILPDERGGVRARHGGAVLGRRCAGHAGNLD